MICFVAVPIVTAAIATRTYTIRRAEGRREPVLRSVLGLAIRKQRIELIRCRHYDPVICHHRRD
jgi:hypothetical protein